jgi:hypothetical protein
LLHYYNFDIEQRSLQWQKCLTDTTCNDNNGYNNIESFGGWDETVSRLKEKDTMLSVGTECTHPSIHHQVRLTDATCNDNNEYDDVESLGNLGIRRDGVKAEGERI